MRHGRCSRPYVDKQSRKNQVQTPFKAAPPRRRSTEVDPSVRGRRKVLANLFRLLGPPGCC